MEFIKEIIINKPISQVWELLGNQYGDAYKWASGINHSKSYGQPKISGAHCNNRTCELPSGKVEEKIRIFNANSYILEYEVIEGFPFFVESGINNWSLQEMSEKTKVHMHLKIKTTGLMGKIMGPIMKNKMEKVTELVVEDLKYFSETGKPSPNKAKELEKLRKK